MKVNQQKKNTSYHQNDYLLFQFVLSEFLRAYPEVIELHTAFQSLKSLYKGKGTLTDKKLALQRLIRATEILSGASYNYMRIFSWNQEGGSLNKLNHYCALFTRNAPGKIKEPQLIYSFVNQSWLACIQLHDFVVALFDLPVNKWNENLAQIESLESKIYRKMNQFTKHLPTIIQEYSNNENVIFYIVRHHQDFERLLSKTFLKNLFNNIFDGGVKEVKNFLLRRYRRRGFSQLLPIISEKLQELQQ